MTAAKITARRKKRTSKHVLKAKEERGKQDAATEAPAQNPLNEQATKPKRKVKSKKMKDPNEATAYLSSWKHRDAGGAWKFNKNTQSWLVRHMYDSEKVDKATFSLLLEYIGGLQGITRARVLSDASRRALRYKEHEKSMQGHSDSGDARGDDDGTNSNGPAAAATEEAEIERSEEEDDNARWKRLDDHEKRREYKRARKLLDNFKQ